MTTIEAMQLVETWRARAVSLGVSEQGSSDSGLCAKYRAHADVLDKCADELERVAGETPEGRADIINDKFDEETWAELIRLREETRWHVELRITTRCPSCGHQSLFVGKGGHLTCSWLECKEPGLERAIQKLTAHPIASAMGEKQKILGSDAKCEECGAYYPYHLTRECSGEHVAPVQPSLETPAPLECDQCGAKSEHYPNMPRTVGDRCPSGSSCDGSMVPVETPEARKDAE
jgi:hypothetical protein